MEILNMAKYFSRDVLAVLTEAGKRIYEIREEIYKQYEIDLLDTDSLSALSIHEVVKQYDENYNPNFSRNGEDAKSLDSSDNVVLVENKTAKIDVNFTKKGKVRKNAGSDAKFLFHANGDIIHNRYVFVARRKDNLDIVRIHDVSSKTGCLVIQTHLAAERDKWRNKGANQKRDIIDLPETLLLSLPMIEEMTIDGVKVRLA